MVFFWDSFLKKSLYVLYIFSSLVLFPSPPKSKESSLTAFEYWEELGDALCGCLIAGRFTMQLQC